MAEKTAEIPQEGTAPATLTPNAISGPKSDSFRGIDYTAPQEGETKPSEAMTSPWWKRFSLSRKERQGFTKSDVVVEKLSAKGLFGSEKGRDPDSPPVTSGVKKAESEKVGLQKVTLVPAEDAAKGTEDIEKGKTQETVEAQGMESIGQITPTLRPEEATEVKTETVVTETVVTGTSESQQVATEEAFAEIPEGEKKEDVAAVDAGTTEQTSPAKETEAQTEATVPAEEGKAPILAERIEGIGGSMKETAAQPKGQEPLTTSQSMAKPTPSQKSIFRRLFTFGSPQAVKEAKEESKETHTAELGPETDTSPKEDAPQVTESTSAKEDSSGSKPPPPETEATESQSAAVEQVVSGTSVKHVSTDLTPIELDELKTLFISEMKLKGFEIEGKYTKSSTEFDSPLTFLLDLHTFAETQHSTVKLENVLKEKYGAGHSIVSEFSAAAGQKESQEKGQTSTTSTYETGLDTAQIDSGDVPKETTPAASSSEAQDENKVPEIVTAATKEDTTNTPDATAQEVQAVPEDPPVIPNLRDETAAGNEPSRCFLCACLAPKVK